MKFLWGWDLMVHSDALDQVSLLVGFGIELFNVDTVIS